MTTGTPTDQGREVSHGWVLTWGRSAFQRLRDAAYVSGGLATAM
jgi:hypothetical protein